MPKAKHYGRGLPVRKGLVTGEAEWGAHWHRLDRASAITEVDGGHTHTFRLPDGSVVSTRVGGHHRHRLEGTAVYAGDHVHDVELPGGRTARTEVSGGHAHELQLESTALDGTHGHLLVLPDGSTIESDVGRDAFNDDAPTPRFAAADWVGSKSDRAVQFFSVGDDVDLLVEVVDAVSGGESPFLIVADDVPFARDVLKKVSNVYRHESGDWGVVIGTNVPTDCYVLPVVKAEWTTAYVNDLPDSAFLHVKPGGEKDDEGKTRPRTLRMFPYRNLEGSIDLPHLRNALARIPQANLDRGTKDRLSSRARRLLVEATKSDVVVSKTFAGYEDFDACVSSQMGDGKDEDDAHRICGRLQSEFEKSADALIVEASAWIVTKQTEDERFILGIVAEPDEVDTQQDTIKSNTIRDAAHKFMEDFRNIGLQHHTVVNGSVKILESHVTLVDQEISGQVVKSGSWILGVRVIDDRIWKSVKDGTFTGFSLGGTAVREPLT